jgi:hypothetical protein
MVPFMHMCFLGTPPWSRGFVTSCAWAMEAGVTLTKHWMSMPKTKTEMWNVVKNGPMKKTISHQTSLGRENTSHDESSKFFSYVPTASSCSNRRMIEQRNHCPLFSWVLPFTSLIFETVALMWISLCHRAPNFQCQFPITSVSSILNS